MDRLRQLQTKFGLRAYRVFLVWTTWTGEERGEGEETVLREIELLPTPRVTDLGSLSRRPYSAGVFPEGSLRVDQISSGAYTEDVLRGLRIPANNVHVGNIPPRSTAVEAHGVNDTELSTNAKIDFWWEVQEDGRGDSPALRRRFRVFGGPSRRPGEVMWACNIELADEARNRVGRATQIGVNAADEDPPSDEDD